MQKIAVIGIDEKKESIMSRLMEFGAVELIDQKSKLADESWRSLVTADDAQDKAAGLEYKMNRADAALRVLEKYDTAKEPLFKTRRTVSARALGEIAEQKSRAEADIAEVLGLEERLKETKDKINRLEQDGIFLTPWQGYEVPLEKQATYKTILIAGTIPQGADTAALAARLASETSGTVFKVIGSDKDVSYVAALTLKHRAEDVIAILKEAGFSEFSFKGFEGSAAENLTRIEKEKEISRAEVTEIEGELAAKAVLRREIENYFDLIAIDADKEKIKSKLLKTNKTFYLEGWLPAGYRDKAAELLESLGCCYKFRDPEEGEEVPVLLENKSFFVPFEAVTEMYSLPDYRGFDPTSIYALFYAVFFGMMFSDAGYGILMSVACFAVLKKFRLEGTMYKMVKLLFYCGISTTFWGAMFGGWFGDFFQVFARTILNKEIVIEPMWFNPLDDPMKLLIFSLILGVIHLFVGMGIKAYMQIKDGQWFDAVCDEGFWYLTIIGLGALLAGASLAPWVPVAGKWLAIAGILGLLLTGGRHNKGIGKITGGLSNVYNITGYMSDILSYARLLALGLATGVIAQVVNTMGSLFGGGPVGLVILLVVFVFGHLLNFAINALGAFIHASRLQYVEFFGKFYEDGGEPFDPFRKKTKYIRIEQEEETK